MRKFKKYDIFKASKINYQELSNDIKYEVALLGGLDIFTDAHVQGVVDITTKICERMKMDYPKLKHCVMCAYLHDLGKVMIPSEILQKTDRLTDEEYEIMKSHTTHGYDICMKYKELKKYAEIIRAHHENFDGTGYPDGLVGNQIPFEAAIIKIADVYDALVRKRQYKEGFPQSEALQIMYEDTKQKKMSARILMRLYECVMLELHEKINVSKSNVEQFENNIQILHDIEHIYKEIYDRGFTPKLEKKLKKYQLAPGYDMSVNANLLIIKQKAKEKEIELLETLLDEDRKIKEQYEILYKFAEKENWYPDEKYY